MPQNPDIDQMKKTGAILGIATLFVSPTLLINKRLGLTMILALNAFLLYQLHNIGKSRRPGANVSNWFSSFFSRQTGDAGANLVTSRDNLFDGGASIYDQAQQAWDRFTPTGVRK